MVEYKKEEEEKRRKKKVTTAAKYGLPITMGGHNKLMIKEMCSWVHLALMDRKEMQ